MRKKWAVLGHVISTWLPPWWWSTLTLVSASDITPTDCWLNVTAHLAGNTSGVSKSSSDWLNYTGFPGDVCVAFFNVPPGNKYAVTLKPPHKRRKPSCLQLTASACQDQLNTGFTKVCEKCKVRGIESLKYVWEFYTPVCYCDDFSTPLNMT